MLNPIIGALVSRLGGFQEPSAVGQPAAQFAHPQAPVGQSPLAALVNQLVTHQQAQAPVSPNGETMHGNPGHSAADQFAMHRIQQLVAAHLLGGMPQNMSDPAATWRTLSASLAQNPAAMQAFLRAAHGYSPQGPSIGTLPSGQYE